ncbi:MAG: stability determinant [Sphingomonas sp.]|uniref:stability determinant n=1 Tax=Sphingomonas sp. TaxID=28214 RepID=UPI001AC1EAFC|nr:stability determinant [Sphingomonas sp.]MBN8814022.1 stability determinant [Sphingomonas sp.]
MKPKAPLADKLDDDIGVTEPGYDAWKRAKVERGLAQAKNRAAMIPAEQVLDTLKLAR